ncbi:hypothetical protein PAMA_014911 [Pampus argenteus]
MEEDVVLEKDGDGTERQESKILSRSQCASIRAKTAVTDQAMLPDDMPSPCLHIQNTLGIYGDSWGRQVYVCCWPQGSGLRPNYLSGIDITYPPANHTQRTTGPCSKAPVNCQLN